MGSRDKRGREKKKPKKRGIKPYGVEDVATNVKVYFCDPHSPWQRGTNENTNRLLWASRLLRVNFTQVLHRPPEPARVTGQVPYQDV